MLRDPDAVREHAEHTLQLEATHQLHSFSWVARLLHGWALAHQGRHEEGIAQIRGSLSVASGQYLRHRGYLAEAYLQAGAAAEALATIADAFAAGLPEEEIFLPRMLWIRCAALAANGADASQVKASYRDSLALAHRFGAKLIELRAATSLGRPLQSSGRAPEARAL